MQESCQSHLVAGVELKRRAESRGFGNSRDLVMGCVRWSCWKDEVAPGYLSRSLCKLPFVDPQRLDLGVKGRSRHAQLRSRARRTRDAATALGQRSFDGLLLVHAHLGRQRAGRPALVRQPAFVYGELFALT